MIERLSLARRQLAARGMMFFVTFLIGDSERDACPLPGAVHAGLQTLRSALGNESVWCLEPQDYSTVWPRFFPAVHQLADRHRSSFPKSTAIAGIHWSWLFCDLHAMVGAFKNSLFAPTTPMARGGHLAGVPEFLWVFDYDISWVGDLAEFVEAFANDPADLLVAKDQGVALAYLNDHGQQTYAQLPVRNYLADSEVHHALLAPVRYSRRMLAASRSLIASGKVAFCETRGVSLCHQQAGWCQHRSMQALRPELFNRNFSCCKSHSERYSRERKMFWEQIPIRERPPVQLLHRVKLDAKTPLAAEAQRLRKERHSPHSSARA